jgi:hypothetical protein
MNSKPSTMKNILFAAFVFASFHSSFAQEKEEEKKGWKRENIFLGTGVNLGFFNGFIIGLNPEVGYSVAKFMDVGLATNFNYISQNDINAPVTYRQTVVGAGPFVRLWPARMFFVGSQFEYNQINYSIKQSGSVVLKEKREAPSLLVGAGYGNRILGGNQFYTSIYIDVLKDVNSPYVDQFNRNLPVFRTSFLFYLRPKSERQNR